MSDARLAPPSLRALAKQSREQARAGLLNYFVVPANAGTHHPWRCLAKDVGSNAQTMRHGVWVPAFAGATLVIVVIHFQNTPPRSRGADARVLQKSFAPIEEGAGKCRVPAAPALAATRKRHAHRIALEKAAEAESETGERQAGKGQ
jgi:hypothetical protein